MATTITGERWETGHGDGAGIYLAGAPATRAKIGDFSEGGRGDSSEVCQARAQLAAAAPELLEAARFVLARGFERKWDGDERAFALLSAAVKKSEGR